MKNFLRLIGLAFALVCLQDVSFAQGTVVFTSDPLVTTALHMKGAFSSSAAYAANDVISSGGSLYFASAPIAAGGSAPPGGLWGLFASTTSSGGGGSLVVPVAYAGGTAYTSGATVIYNGVVYASLAAGNAGNTPSTSPSSWAAFADAPGAAAAVQTIATTAQTTATNAATAAAAAQTSATNAGTAASAAQTTATSAQTAAGTAQTAATAAQTTATNAGTAASAAQTTATSAQTAAGTAQTAANAAQTTATNAGTAAATAQTTANGAQTSATNAGTAASAAQTTANGAPQKANNLNDLPNAATARTSLGLGSAAVRNIAGSDPGSVCALPATLGVAGNSLVVDPITHCPKDLGTPPAAVGNPGDAAVNGGGGAVNSYGPLSGISNLQTVSTAVVQNTMLSQDPANIGRFTTSALGKCGKPAHSSVASGATLFLYDTISAWTLIADGAVVGGDLLIPSTTNPGHVQDSLTNDRTTLGYNQEVCAKSIQTIASAGTVLAEPLAVGSRGLQQGAAQMSLTPQTQSILNSTWASYLAAGDSLTVGASQTATSEQYVNIIAAATGTGSSLTNIGVGGDTSCDAANHIFNNVNEDVGSTKLMTLMIGINNTDFGIGTNAEAMFRMCHQAGLAWMASASSKKVTGATVTAATNWSTDTTFSKVTGLQSTTNGAVQTWPYTTTGAQGMTALVFYRIIDGNGGKFQLATDDGISVPLTNYTAQCICSPNGATSGVGVYVSQYYLRSAGSHTITTTVTSATGAGNVVSILGVAWVPTPVLQAPAVTTPAVWSAGITRELNDINSAITQQYNDDALDDVAILQQAGLPINAVNVRNFMFSTPSEMSLTAGNFKHPVSGHREIAYAFLSPTVEIKPKIPNIATLTINNVSCSLASTTSCTVDPTTYPVFVNPNSATFSPTCLQNEALYTASVANVTTLPTTCVTGKSLILINASGTAGANVTFTGSTASGPAGANSLVLAPCESATISTYGATNAVSTAWYVVNKGGYYTTVGTCSKPFYDNLADSTIASAATIAPTTSMVEISGTFATMTSATPHLAGTNACFDALATGAWTLVAGTSTNNYFAGLTAAVGTQYRFCRWSDGLWHVK